MYFASVMVISTMSILANVFVLSLHHKNVKIQPPMPKWVEKWICGYLAKLLRMDKPYKLLNTNKKAPSYVTFNAFSDKKLLPNICDNDFSSEINELKICHKKILSELRYKQRSLDEPMEKVYISNSCNNSLKRKKNNLLICENCNNMMLTSNKSELNSLKDCLIRILKEIEILTNKTKQDLDEEHRQLNWKFAAMVIDRLCMILFALATITSTFTFGMNLFLTFD
jgi:DNA-directed RNA polymerase subunit M/transcription elongation factor TFIIS